MSELVIFPNENYMEKKCKKQKMNNVLEIKGYTAPNERFCVIAAVTPQIMQCKLASYYPAASSVEAATTQSRHPVSRHP